MELIELFQLFLGKHFREGLHAVDAVFEQGLVGIEHLGLRVFGCGLVAAFERFAQCLLCVVLLLAQFLEYGISLRAVGIEGGLLLGSSFLTSS